MKVDIGIHINTKIPKGELTPSMNGYFMKCNKSCNDPLGYILNLDMTPEEFEKGFQSLLKRSSHLIFFDFSKI